MKKIVSLLLLSGAMAVLLHAESLEEKLQKGLFEEEANHNLSAAIEQYQSVVSQADQQRKLAATALFRLGESYRKLGREAEARDAYARLRRDFSDQQQLIERVPGGYAPTPLVGVSREAMPRPFWETQHANELSALAKLLESSPDLLNSSYTNNQSLLEYAAAQGDLDKLRFLLEHGASPNRNSKDAPHALSIAVSHGNKKAVELLVNGGADVNLATAINGLSPLHTAASEGFTAISEFLIEKGAEVNSREIGGRSTPLHLAALRGQEQEIELLLKHRALIDATNRSGATPLQSAIRQQQSPEVIRTLLAAGADPNKIGEFGVTSLMTAISAGSESLAKLLLENKADPNRKSARGETPLQEAVAAFPIAFSALLLEHGADPNVRNSFGETPLHIASGGHVVRPAGNGLYSVGPTQPDPGKVELLLSHGSEPNVLDDEGKSPLFYAAISGEQQRALSVVKLLLNAKADPNLKNEKTKNSLNDASENVRMFNPAVFELLKDHGLTNNLPQLGVNSAATTNSQRRIPRPQIAQPGVAQPAVGQPAPLE